jgi:hypothetical protein
MVPNAPPRASMAPTLAKLDSMAQRTAAEISGTNYKDGFNAGKRHAYRRTAYTLAALMACGAVVAWVIG